MNKDNLKALQKQLEKTRNEDLPAETIKSLWADINEGFAPPNYVDDDYGRFPQ